MLGSAEYVDGERMVAALGYGAGFAVGQSHDGKEGAENFLREERVYGEGQEMSFGYESNEKVRRDCARWWNSTR